MGTVDVVSPKKLIEVALPLDAINAEAAREKSIRHGHPSTLHLWWARRPLAAARAVIFGQLVNDPASLWEAQNPGQKPSQQQRGGFTQRRTYLFKLLSELVKWENSTNEEILGKARAEIRQSWREVCALNHGHPDAKTLFDPEKMPGLHDPFAGGGAIPLEAQRLGLEAFASDLNPVAVLINKAMIEIPPKFAGRPPVHPDARREGALRQWKGAEGLAEDVRHYGGWMREEAQKRIGHLYPKVLVTDEMAKERPDLKPLVGQELTVIAWLWARTVKSPNPAFSHVDVPLVTSFLLGSKPGNEWWVEPRVQGDRYAFAVRSGAPPPGAETGTKVGRGASFRCIVSGVAMDPEYIREEAAAGRMATTLIAVVAQGSRARAYLPGTTEMETLALSAKPHWLPSGTLPDDARAFTPILYGFSTWSSHFTSRQAATLSVLVDLVSEVATRSREDAAKSGLSADDHPMEGGGRGSHAYSQAVALYSAFIVDKEAEALSTVCTWSSHPKNELVVSTFKRQAIPMTWDFAEANPFGDSSGSLEKNTEAIARAIARLQGTIPAEVRQCAAQQVELPNRVVSTDPPYYDNIGYADLSDFFYVWLRRSLRDVFPGMFASIVAPKAEELVAAPHRHGGKAASEAFFMTGMSAAMARTSTQVHPALPTTIYYAFKQSDTDSSTGTSSSGWETFLDAVVKSGFQLTGTWPMRTERTGRTRDNASNALASSVVLVCRKRPSTAATVSRREFIRELNAALPLALDEMTRGAGDDQSPVAPVDLSQAIIGPGMAVFSKYAAVLEADGTPMTVKTALQLINRFLAEDDFDADTQFCLHWFEQKGWDEGAYGDADVLARAKATSVAGVDQAGVVVSGGGKVRLRRPADYPTDWDPRKDKRLPVWEALHQLVRVFRSDGESGAGAILAAVKAKSEAIRQLAYRLYTLCERRGWAEDARGYNDLVTAWPAIEAVANAAPVVDDQLHMFGKT